jgi:hypothetical protein
MKKVCLLFVLMFLLTGCSFQTFEQVHDGEEVPAMAVPATVQINLPEDAASPTMQGESGTLYFCGDYDIGVEILPSGNLSSTLQSLTGFEKENLNLIQTVRGGAVCYEGVWSAVGEAGDMIGRVLVLDDGKYHYCVSVMANADNAGTYAEEWNKVLSSVVLTDA